MLYYVVFVGVRVMFRHRDPVTAARVAHTLRRCGVRALVVDMPEGALASVYARGAWGEDVPF